MTLKTRERYINYAQQVDPEIKVKSDPGAANANSGYASILMYIKSNPAKSAKFISDIKSKFFNDTCTVKETIDYNKILELPDGAPFS